MRPLLLSSLLLPVSLATVAPRRNSPPLYRRDFTEACADLSVSANNGDRKVAVVIDSSGSMSSNDPSKLRISAGQALNAFLISNAEAGGGKKADQITVIDFDDTPTLLYPLGDPGNANSSFTGIDASGGTFIAGGVTKAIEEITKTGDTDKRSAIVVFTDGEDSSTSQLVTAIKKATGLGIRVSFGFLDTSASNQDEDILNALRESRGVYATITRAAGSPNFINYVLLNGLTYNDNPQGYDAQLLSGLSMTHYVTGSETKTLKYAAEAGEDVTFLITDISTDGIQASAQMNGQTIGSVPLFSTSRTLNVKAPSTGEMLLVVKADISPPDGMFSVSTNSNIPIKNCTVAVGSPSSGGLSTGAKAGIGVGVTAAVLGLLGAGGYFAYKHFFTSGGPGGGVPAPTVADGGLSAQTPMGAEKLAPHAHTTWMDPSTAMSAGDGGLSSPHHTAGLGGGGPPAPTAYAPGAETGGLPYTAGAEAGGLPHAAGPPSSGFEGGLQSATPGAPGGGGPTPTVGPGGGGAPPPLMDLPNVFMPIVPPIPPPPSGPTSPHTQQPVSPAHPHGPYSPPNPAYPPAAPYYPGGHPASPAPYPYAHSPHASPPPPQGPVYHAPPPQQQPLSPYGNAPPSAQSPHASPPPPQNPAYQPPAHSPGSWGAPAPAPSPHAGSPPPGAYPYGPPLAAVPVGGFAVGQQRQKHHHHPWLQGDEPCTDGGCPYNLPGHACQSQRCECTCWNDACPLNR